MKILVTQKTFIFHSNPQSPTSKFLSNPTNHLQFPFKTPKDQTPSNLTATPCSSSPSISSLAVADPIYGGWDELDQSNAPSSSSLLRSILVSLGFDDRKFVFVFLLGVVSALAIARVRVSTILVFPASIVVFAAGFSFGFFKTRTGNDASEIVKRGVGNNDDEHEHVRVCLKELRILFDSFDDKLVSVKNAVNGGDIRNDVEIIDSLCLLVSNGKMAVDTCMKSFGDFSDDLVDDHKSGRKRNEASQHGFDFMKFFGGLFQQPSNSAGSKLNKPKDGNVVSDEMDLTPKVHDFLEPVNDISMKPVMPNRDATDRAKWENGGIDFDWGAERSIEDEDYSENNPRFQTENDRRISYNTGHRNTRETWASYDSSLDDINFRVCVQRKETETSFHQEQILRRKYSPSDTRDGKESRESDIRETREYRESGSDNEFTDMGYNGYSSSSMFSDDVLFDKYLAEASGSLKQARELLRSGKDEERIKIILHNSTELLSRAVAMKPASLLAVGQLGNTYLLHGELNLKTSRELRSLLRGSKGRSDYDLRKNKIASRLVNVCEECEELLVQAGKKYRMALSIDSTDTRALYNWGLALSFRAQLLADIGPKAASDADKVFLAAIDKFDAMMSRSNNNAPDALFRWGVALQQRSRLRPHNSKEKVKLLRQAKQLYEDAIDLDSKNVQVRRALSSCISELNLRLIMAFRKLHNSKEKVKLLRQAKQLYEDAIDLDSKNVQVRRALSSCISELNLRRF